MCRGWILRVGACGFRAIGLKQAVGFRAWGDQGLRFRTLSLRFRISGFVGAMISDFFCKEAKYLAKAWSFLN